MRKRRKLFLWWHCFWHQFGYYEFLYVSLIAVLGIVFSSRTWILWMNTLNPIEGFALYSIGIFYGPIWLLSKFGLTLFSFKIKSLSQTFGVWLMTFPYFMITDWQSGWVQWVVTCGQGACRMGGEANLFINNSPDGFSWYIFSTLIFPGLLPNSIRWIVFFFFATFCAFIGVVLAKGKPPELS